MSSKACTKTRLQGSAARMQQQDLLMPLRLLIAHVHERRTAGSCCTIQAN